MNKDEFLKLDIKDKIEFINTKRREGFSSKEIRNSLQISEKRFQKLIKDANYVFSQKDKIYILNEESLNNRNYESNAIVVGKEKDYKSSEIVVTNNEYTKLISMLNNIDDMNSKLEEMYKWYTLQTNVVEPIELKIDKFDDIVVTRSYKIYNEIQKEFADYCKSQPYRTQDIISQALREFLQKYK